VFAILCATVMFLQAGIIATNQNVTARMDSSSGSENDRAVYILTDGYSADYTDGVYVGYNNSYISLIVSNGASLTKTNDILFYISRKLTCSYNKLIITGSDSKVQFGPLSADGIFDFAVGFTGSTNNTLEILDGASFTIAGDFISYPSVLPSVIMDNNSSLHCYSRSYLGGTHGVASLSIKNGSTFYCGNRVSVGGGREALVEVNGFGSKLETSGQFRYSGTNSLVSTENDALIRIPSASITYYTDPTSFFGLAGGFLACKDNMDSTIYFKLWNGTSWVQPASLAAAEALGWSKTTYATDEEALAETGYDGLGGYTIYTGGERMAPIVPDGTCIIIK